MNKAKIIGAAVSLGLVLAPLNLHAQDRSDRSADMADYYDYCQDRARDLSGYDGRTPERYRRGGALEGASRGARDATIRSLLSGESRQERREARRRGAVIGGILGALARSGERREEQRQARMYRLELDECMRSGGY